MRHLWLSLFLASVACGEVQKLDVDAGADADLCTGTCECVVDTDCAAVHTFCNDQITTRTCECAAGYTAGVSGACEWSGVIADPGFQAASQWTTQADVTVDVNQNIAGMVDPGVVRFKGVGLCSIERATQSVEMPKFSRAEPLVAVTTYRFVSGGGFDFIGAAIGVGPTWHDDTAPSFSSFVTARFCLGASQYAPESTKGKGAVLDLVVMPVRAPQSCNPADPNTAFEIDHVEILPANPNECPAPGTASNGDVEGAGGWAFAVSVANPQNPDTSTAQIEAGVGEASTHGARLFMNHRCDGVSLTNRISIPDAGTLASPAISIFNRTSSTAQAIWSLGGVPLPAISGSGQPATIKVCAPAFMRGGAYGLAANIEDSGACADAPNFESVFDNFKLVNEPSCGTDTTITDPGFESSLLLLGATATQGKSLSRAINDPVNAHTGNGVLQLSVSFPCDGPAWQANVVTPASTGGAGPALTFFYKATPAADYTFAVTTSGGSFTPTLDNTYHQGKICLNPKLVGRNAAVRFVMSGGGGTCATPNPTTEGAFVDDLQVTTDPTCPAM